jgi:hypothetical protein
MSETFNYELKGKDESNHDDSKPSISLQKRIRALDNNDNVNPIKTKNLKMKWKPYSIIIICYYIATMFVSFYFIKDKFYRDNTTKKIDKMKFIKVTSIIFFINIGQIVMIQFIMGKFNKADNSLVA